MKKNTYSKGSPLCQKVDQNSTLRMLFLRTSFAKSHRLSLITKATCCFQATNPEFCTPLKFSFPNSKKKQPHESADQLINGYSTHKVCIVDGMAVVNHLDKNTSCKEFADIFLKSIQKIAELADEVRLVFDRFF